MDSCSCFSFSVFTLLGLLGGLIDDRLPEVPDRLSFECSFSNEIRSAALGDLGDADAGLTLS